MPVSSAINIEDLRRYAAKRLPRMVFDYIDGGADDEVTLEDNCDRFAAYKLKGNALVDVSDIDLGTTILGAQSKLPVMISPTAASRLFHPRQGERAVARAATKASLIYSASTLASVTLEELSKLAPGPKWFQVYVWKDRALVEGILDRVRKAGFTTLILTVDTPVAGNRERDPRNGFSIPPSINSKTVSQALVRPGYLFDVFTTPEIGPANFPKSGNSQGIVDFINEQFDRSVTWDYVTWLKEVWGGPVAVKGIAHAEDARRAVNAGADAVWISNHGGRQLDTARATIDCLPEIAEAVGGQTEIIFDGGVRRGSHILKALALGATSVAIGRAYLYGLAAGGERGVSRAISILESELERTMALMGCAKLSDITRESVVSPFD